MLRCCVAADLPHPSECGDSERAAERWRLHDCERHVGNLCEQVRALLRDVADALCACFPASRLAWHVCCTPTSRLPPRLSCPPPCCSIVGLGTTGPTPFSHTCSAGQKVLGIDVSACLSSPAAALPVHWRRHALRVARLCVGTCRFTLLQVATNATAAGPRVSGLRFLCGDPTCSGQTVFPPPPGAAAAPAPAPPAPNATDPGWSAWLGRTGAANASGICPCPGYIQVSAPAAAGAALMKRQPAKHVPAHVVASTWALNDSSPLSLAAECQPVVGAGLAGHCH